MFFLKVWSTQFCVVKRHLEENGGNNTDWKKSALMCCSLSSMIILFFSLIEKTPYIFLLFHPIMLLQCLRSVHWSRSLWKHFFSDTLLIFPRIETNLVWGLNLALSCSAARVLLHHFEMFGLVSPCHFSLLYTRLTPAEKFPLSISLWIVPPILFLVNISGKFQLAVCLLSTPSATERHVQSHLNHFPFHLLLFFPCLLILSGRQQVPLEQGQLPTLLRRHGWRQVRGSCSRTLAYQSWPPTKPQTSVLECIRQRFFL